MQSTVCLCWLLEDFDSPELETDVEAVKEVAAEDERVDGSEHCVNPAGRNEHRLPYIIHAQNSSNLHVIYTQ